MPSAPARNAALASLRLSATPPLGPCVGTGLLYSMTSSARSIIDGGTERPRAVAVLRFTTISNLVGNYTGRAPGFSPRRMRSRYGQDKKNSREGPATLRR